MQCEPCHEKEASVQVNLLINRKMTQLHLCGEMLCQNGRRRSFPCQQRPFRPAGKKRGGILDQMGLNLNDAAKAGLIDAVIGRDEEIQRVIEVLNRRNKNNPVLIGEPRVGKTAFAEGFALRITEGKVPAKLLDKEDYSLDVASIFAGTGIRGKFKFGPVWKPSRR